MKRVIRILTGMTELLPPMACHTQAAQHLPPRNVPHSSESPHCSTQVPNQELFIVPESTWLTYSISWERPGNPKSPDYPGHLALPFPSSPSSHLSRSSQRTKLGSLFYIAASHQLSYEWSCLYFNATFSIYSTPCFLHCVRKSIFYICISIPPLKWVHQYHFSRLYIHIYICIHTYIFSFWLYSV